MPMDFEGSISSWIGKIREGFDTFCLEAKDILPQKPVENVQDRLVTAAERLKFFCFDLNVFSTFKLDSEQGNNSPKSAEMEEEIDVHSENKSNDAESAEMEEKMDLGLVKLWPIPIGVEPENSRTPVSFSKFDTWSSEFPTSPVGSYEEADDISDSDFEFQVSRFAREEDNSTKRFNFEEVPSEWYMPPDSLEGLEGLYARLMASYKSSSISGPKFCSSTQDNALTEDDSYGETGSDSQFENQNPDYSHLLGHELRDELIKHGFLSPLSGSVQSIISEQSNETEEIDSSSDAKVTSSVDSISSKTSNCVESIQFGSTDTDSIPDMSDCWSNSNESPVCDVVAIAAAAQQNLDDSAEIELDDEWERLDDDWEIVRI